MKLMTYSEMEEEDEKNKVEQKDRKKSQKPKITTRILIPGKL